MAICSELCIEITRNDMKHQKNSKLYILLLVGAISAFGPFVTDFYLPALPALTKYFTTTASYVQLSLTCSMIGLAVGQLIIGPMSDRYGRKSPLLMSMFIFCLSTIGCLYSPDIRYFVIFRLVQGLAGAGGVVISKSIAVDLYSGKELVSFFSILSSIQGIAPIAAPVLGGFLLEFAGWKDIFWILLCIGVIMIIYIIFFIDSLPKAKRQGCKISNIFGKYTNVLRNNRFMRYVLVQGFAMGVMFAYIAASPFIFQEHFNMPPLMFSLCFGINALAIMAGSLCVPRFKSATKALSVGAGGFAIMSIFVTTLLLTIDSVFATEGALLVMMFFLGLVLPTSTTLALDLERENSGSASAILGFIMFLFGGMISPLTGVGNMIYSTSIIIVICSLLTWAVNKSIKTTKSSDTAQL